MVTWEQIVALPEYQQATPEKQAKVRELYLGMVSEKVGRAKDVMGGKAVTEASNASQQQATQEQAVARSARSKMESMRQRGVKVPEEEALRTPVYDPVDLVVDAATGFMGSAGKAALKAGGKALAKNVAREVGTGAVAGAGMALADKAGAGAVGQLAAGLGGGVVGGAALTGTRRLIASMMKRGMPESQAARIVGEMTPEAVEKAVKALEPTPGRIGKQTPVKRIGIAQAADASRLADDVTVHPEAADYADMMAGYTPKQGRQGIPPVDAQGRRLQAVTERYHYQQAPMEGPFGVEDTLKPVPKVEVVAKPKPAEVDPYLEQTGGFVPEEGVDVGRRVPIPESVRHLPEGVTRGEDGKLYITIAQARKNPPKREAKTIQDILLKEPWERTPNEIAILEASDIQDVLDETQDAFKGYMRTDLLKEVKAHGKLNYRKVKAAIGETEAKDLMKKLGPGYFTKGTAGRGLDELASELEPPMSTNALYGSLMGWQSGTGKQKAAFYSPGNLGIVAPGTVANPVKLDPFATEFMEFSPPKKGFMQAIKDKAKSIYTGLFDETAPITRSVRETAGPEAAHDVDIAIGQTRGTSAKIEQDVERLYDTVKSALRNEQEYVDWETYRVAKRMVELKGAGKRVNAGNAQEASEALARLTQKYGPEGIRRFDALSETVRREFDGKILDMARELGQISDETYNAIRSAPESSAYAAFLRIMDDEADAMGLPKVVMPGESVRTLKGGSQRLAPTLDATVVNLARIHRMADQMRVNNLLVSLRDQHPGLADLIRPVGQVDGPHPKNSFFTYDNGHKVYWQVPADIAEALQFYGAKPVWEIARLASPVTRLLRVGATLNPEFMFGKNPLRDMQSSAVIVGTPPVKGFLDGLYHVLKSKIGTDEVIKELIKDGGGSASMFALDREAVAGARARKLSWDTKGTKMLKHPVQFLRAMMELAEQSQRVGNYLHLKRQGKSGAEAAVEGARRGTLDFGHFGKHGRSLNSLIAFWNAAMREQDQLVRKLFLGGKDSMKVWMRGSLYLTAPAIALWYRQKDDPRYQELPSWRKYSFWNIVTPKAIISLPRPFALGLLFAGIPEAALNVAYKKDPDAISEWAKTFAGAFFPDFIPTAAKPAIEVATNKNFFTGREVVPRSVENLPEEMQVTPATSRTAEVIGKYLHYSPVKIDHLIRGYAAGLGKTAVDVADRWLGDERVRPAKKAVERIPVVKGLVASEPVGYGSASVQAFYRLWDEMDKNYRGLKALYEDGDRAALAERVRKAPALVRHYEDAKEIQKFFSESWKAIQAIQASQEIDPVRKREAIDRIGSLMTKVARAFLKRYYAKGE